MADWLLAKRTLAGKTRAEVVALLGEPPPTGYFREWDMVYWLATNEGTALIRNGSWCAWTPINE